MILPLPYGGGSVGEPLPYPRGSGRLSGGRVCSDRIHAVRLLAIAFGTRFGGAIWG